ncbi:MAG TPA: DUF2953 domain-containing protein [Clostridiaceae bacterium]|nr:DUF2953 domain-containing protein [Clostridiaceae bacterium]
MLYPLFLSVNVEVIIIAVVLLILVILISNIRVSTKFECIKKRDSSDILILFYLFSGLLKQQYEIPLTNISDLFKVIYELLFSEKGILLYKKTDKVKKDEKEKEDKDNRINKIISYIRPYLFKIQKYLVDRNKIYAKLNIKVIFGANDAFVTGILGGLVFGIAGCIDSLFSNYFFIEEKNINIQPDFTKNVFELEALCILNVRLVNIIKAGIFFILIYISNKIKRTGGGING